MDDAHEEGVKNERGFENVFQWSSLQCVTVANGSSLDGIVVDAFGRKVLIKEKVYDDRRNEEEEVVS